VAGRKAEEFRRSKGGKGGTRKTRACAVGDGAIKEEVLA